MLNIITRYSRIEQIEKTIESLNKQINNIQINHYITYENEKPKLSDNDFLKNTIFIKVPKIQIIDYLGLYYHHNDYHTDYTKFSLNENCFYYFSKEKPKVEKIKFDILKFEKNGYWCTTLGESVVPYCEHFPPNIYLKIAEDYIKDGWILYLDDGDIFENDTSIKKLIDEINNHDEDTLHIFKLMNRGRLWTTPREGIWRTHLSLGHPLILGECSGSCICFHSKWKEHTKWDEFRKSDYRTARALESIIPKRNLFDEIIIYTP